MQVYAGSSPTDADHCKELVSASSCSLNDVKLLNDEKNHYYYFPLGPSNLTLKYPQRGIRACIYSMFVVLKCVFESRASQKWIGEGVLSMV